MIRFPNDDPGLLRRLPPPLRSLVRAELRRCHETAARTNTTYTPERDGEVIVLESGDTDEYLTEQLGGPLHRLVFEEVRVDDSARCLVGLLLANNACLHAVVVPDDEHLDGATRAHLLGFARGGES